MAAIRRRVLKPPPQQVLSGTRARIGACISSEDIGVVAQPHHPFLGAGGWGQAGESSSKTISTASIGSRTTLGRAAGLTLPGRALGRRA
jgi:hypothetical protein